MTFDEATTFANETGWYIYHLGQLLQSEGFDADSWECCLRESEGRYRRSIARGKGDSAAEAVFNALSSIPEEERETKALREVVENRFGSSSDLLSLIGTKLKPQPTRTRA